MTEEEYDDLISNVIKEFFPSLVGKQYCIIWKTFELFPF